MPLRPEYHRFFDSLAENAVSGTILVEWQQGEIRDIQNRLINKPADIIEAFTDDVAVPESTVKRKVLIVRRAGPK